MRVIDETGQQIGVMSIQEALHLAKERGLDLIQVTEKVEPPVCKLMEYGKYKYQEEKKQRRAKPQRGELKTIRLTFNISPHDIEVRANQAAKFLQRGDKVMVDIPLTGRQRTLQDFAKERVQKFLEMVAARTPYRVERELKKEPRGMTMIITKG